MKVHERFKRGPLRPLIWAHRGASGYAPENTMASFEKAARLHADGIELDVQMSRDGELVIIHDEKINRTSNGRGWVKDMTFRELCRYRFNKKFPDCPDGRIPTLQEVYALAKDTGMTVNVELKTGKVFYHDLEERVVELTAKMGMEEQVLYSSFNHYTCERLRFLCPDAYIGFLCSDGAINYPRYCWEHRGSALHPSFYNLQYPDFMKEAREDGIDVNVWTVNEPDDMKICAGMGVNAIITNYPDRAWQIYSEHTGMYTV